MKTTSEPNPFLNLIVAIRIAMQAYQDWWLRLFNLEMPSKWKR